MSTIIGAIVTGLIGGLILWLRWKQAAADKAHADSMDSQAAGEATAADTEAKLLDAKEKAEREKPKSPTDWQ